MLVAKQLSLDLYIACDETTKAIIQHKTTKLSIRSQIGLLTDMNNRQIYKASKCKI